MKIKDDFYIKKVADMNIVVATGETSEDMNSMITLNDTAAFLWKNLENNTTEEELTAKLTNEYEVDYERAKRSVQGFIEKLDKIGCISF